MPTWILEDDCMVPERTIRIDYKGPNPFKLYKAIPGFLRTIFDVRGKDVYEREFRWDYSGDPRDFLSRFAVRKSYDMWTAVWIEAFMQGKQPSDPNKDGEVFILLTGKLVTKSKEDSPWARSGFYKSLRWIYFRSLYNTIRRNYLEECRIKIFDLKRALERTLGIAPDIASR